MKMIFREEFSYFVLLNFFILEIYISKRYTHFSFTIFEMCICSILTSLFYTNPHWATHIPLSFTPHPNSPTPHPKNQSFLRSKTVSKIELVPPISLLCKRTKTSRNEALCLRGIHFSKLDGIQTEIDKIPNIDFVEIFLCVYISTFCKFWMHIGERQYIFRHFLQKVKMFVFFRFLSHSLPMFYLFFEASLIPIFWNGSIVSVR